MSSNSLVIKYFEDLHQIPEPAWHEVKTSAYIASVLEDSGYTVTRNVAGTGVIGILEGTEPGPTLGLRADMDALTFNIGNTIKYIHACGHDSHSAMVLAAAVNAAKKGIIKGRLKVIFQPAEEVDTGALGMIKEGVLDDLDMLFAMHIRPIHELSDNQATPAILHGSCYMIEASLEGVSSHAGRPHLGINAAQIAVQIVNNINAIQLDPSIQHSAKVTKIVAGGDSLNTIPDRADIAIDLRAQTNVIMDELIRRTLTIIESTAELFGGKSDAKVTCGVPAAEINPEAAELARKAIENVLGESNVVENIVSPGGDDFHYYIKNKPTLKATYIGLGCNLRPGLHHPEMSFNVDSLINGVRIYEDIINNTLKFK